MNLLPLEVLAMLCNSRPEITSEQIKICEKCKFASAKKIWCSKFGFYFKEPSKIIQPDKKLILTNETHTTHTQIPQPVERPKPTLLQMAADFTKAMLRWSKSSLACVFKEEYVRRRTICSECTNGWRCPHCGCMLWAKVALVTEKCPEGKW
ncbi:MAG: hypothetical protein LLF92_09325 [Planctomycetaceae bacterium]|nr:hypothetical protein [Planctomycetaceae bacterium]